MSDVKAVPEGSRTITPHLVFDECAKAIEFYKVAFGAEELSRMPGPEGKIMHAALMIGDSQLWMADAMMEPGITPKALGGSPVTMHLYVEDCDAWMKRAVAAGAKVKMPMADMFWGDRYGMVVDPFGHRWSIATHKEDLTPEQMMARMAAMPPMP